MRLAADSEGVNPSAGDAPEEEHREHSLRVKGLRVGPFESVQGFVVIGVFVGADLQRGVPVLLVDSGGRGLTKCSYVVGGRAGEDLAGLAPGGAVAVLARASVRQGMYGPFVAYTALAVQRLCDECHWTRPDPERGGRLCRGCAKRAR